MTTLVAAAAWLIGVVFEPHDHAARSRDLLRRGYHVRVAVPFGRWWRYERGRSDGSPDYVVRRFGPVFLFTLPSRRQLAQRLIERAAGVAFLNERANEAEMKWRAASDELRALRDNMPSARAGVQ